VTAWKRPKQLLLLKTHAERYPALQHRVLALHTYSVPEVLALSVETGAPAYLRCVQDSVTAEGR
jgi:periplasmic divalent cation tolerance protein